LRQIIEIREYLTKWGLCTRAFVSVTNHDHEYTCRKKHNQDVRWKGNVRSRGCVQVAFITSDGVIKVSTLSPLLSTPPSFCLDTQRNVGRGGGAWRCVGESKKRKKGECCDSYCSRRHVIYSWNVAAHTCLCIYVISDIFRFICSPKNLMEFSYLWSEYFEMEKCILCDYVLDEA